MRLHINLQYNEFHSNRPHLLFKALFPIRKKTRTVFSPVIAQGWKLCCLGFQVYWAKRGVGISHVGKKSPSLYKWSAWRNEQNRPGIPVFRLIIKSPPGRESISADPPLPSARLFLPAVTNRFNLAWPRLRGAGGRDCIAALRSAGLRDEISAHQLSVIPFHISSAPMWELLTSETSKHSVFYF